MTSLDSETRVERLVVWTHRSYDMSPIVDALLSQVSHSESWVAFDCETTGLTPRSRVIEIGAIHFNASGENVGQFQQLANPHCRIPRIVTDLTGLTDEDIRDAPPSQQVIQQFLEWLPPDAPIMAHNVEFDLQMFANGLSSSGTILSRRVILDTLQLARALGIFNDCRLSTIANTLNDQPVLRLHRSLCDAAVVKQLFLHARVLRQGKVLDPSIPDDGPASGHRCLSTK